MCLCEGPQPQALSWPHSSLSGGWPAPGSSRGGCFCSSGRLLSQPIWLPTHSWTSVPWGVLGRDATHSYGGRVRPCTSTANLLDISRAVPALLPAHSPWLGHASLLAQSPIRGASITRLDHGWSCSLRILAEGQGVLARIVFSKDWKGTWLSSSLSASFYRGGK